MLHKDTRENNWVPRHVYMLLILFPLYLNLILICVCVCVCVCERRCGGEEGLSVFFASAFIFFTFF